MPNRKKFNARFPPARIKKIMRTDKEVGKVAAPVPAVISRALELFAQRLLEQAGEITVSRGSRTLSPAHLKQCIMSDRRFDFLKDLVDSVPDASEAQPPDLAESSDVFAAVAAAVPASASAAATATVTSRSSAAVAPPPDSSKLRRPAEIAPAPPAASSSSNGNTPHRRHVAGLPPVPALVHASQLRLSGGGVGHTGGAGAALSAGPPLYAVPAGAHAQLSAQQQHGRLPPHAQPPASVYPGSVLSFPGGVSMYPLPPPPPAHQGAVAAPPPPPQPLAVSYGALPDTGAGDAL